jgi:hypothetical protein
MSDDEGSSGSGGIGGTDKTRMAEALEKQLRENPHLRTAKVSTIYEAGYTMDLAVDEPCRECGHVWGEHLLYSMFEDVLDGGYVTCAQQNCHCLGTWGARHGHANAEAARAAWAERQRAEQDRRDAEAFGQRYERNEPK